LQKSPSQLISFGKYEDIPKNYSIDKKSIKYSSLPHTPNKQKPEKNHLVNNLNYVDQSKTINPSNTLQKNSSVPSLLNHTNIDQNLLGTLTIKKYSTKSKNLNLSSNTNKSISKENVNRIGGLLSNRNKPLKTLDFKPAKSPALTFEEHLQKLLAEKEEYINKIKHKKKMLKARYKNLEMEYKNLLDKHKDCANCAKDIVKGTSREAIDNTGETLKSNITKYSIAPNDDKKTLNLTNNLSSNYNTSASVSQNKYRKNFNSFTERRNEDSQNNKNESTSFNNMGKRSSSVLEQNKAILDSFNYKTLDLKEQFFEKLDNTDNSNNQVISQSTPVNSLNKLHVLMDIKRRTQVLLECYASGSSKKTGNIQA